MEKYTTMHVTMQIINDELTKDSNGFMLNPIISLQLKSAFSTLEEVGSYFIGPLKISLQLRVHSHAESGFFIILYRPPSSPSLRVDSHFLEIQSLIRGGAFHIGH